MSSTDTRELANAAAHRLWGEFRAYRDQVRFRYQELEPADPHRQELLALWTYLAELGDALHGLLSVPVDAVVEMRPSRVGEDTQEFLAARKPMRRNGRWSTL
ncbi:hypothetical protein [Paractinoplanes deccanensis]|uniref:hypothetical protein n=1 Tax=Paractinoplanes deccanensis TaxID=113561 RepID=UPI00194373FC|nr:hypothetical protein [Actinoplanes deccanensis]